MSAAEIIAQFKRLPPAEKGKVFKALLSDSDGDDAFFAWADSLPIDRTMTEDEILALPRERPRREGSA